MRAYRGPVPPAGTARTISKMQEVPVDATAQPSQQGGAKPTIVLVHGAFADASCWNGVIERLQQQGSTMRTAPG